jgi:hypothetical protein
MASALGASNLAPVMFVQLDFDSGTVRVTNLAFDIVWNGNTWLGAAYVGSIDAIVENETIQANGLSFTLSGIPSALIATALGEQYQGRKAQVWLGAISAAALVADPVLVFSGRMDVMNISLGSTATIKVNAESRLADFERPRIRRYNDADQRALYPSDPSFQYVPQMINKSLYWGVANPPPPSAI